MTAEYYRNILLKRWRLIILCSFLLGAGAAVGSLFVPSVYQSTVTIQLVMSPADATLLSSTDASTKDFIITQTNQYLQTEVDLASSNTILAQVVVHYAGLSAEQLKSEVLALAVTNSRLFQVTVSDHDPSRAAHLANDLAAVLVAQQAQATQQSNTRSQQPVLDSLAATQRQIDADTATLSSLQSNPAANQQQIQTLQTELSDLQKQRDQEQQTLANVQNIEAMTAGFLQVVDAAQPSSKPMHPELWLIDTAAGLGFGLLLGILLVLLRDRFDQRIPTVPALTELLGWPLLEELGTPASEKTHPMGDDEQERPRPLDAYHTLRQNLDFLCTETPLSSIAVTGTLADGKRANRVAGDLALLLANEGKRVILVDANFSRPSQHRRFGTPSEPGLGAATLAFNEVGGAEKSLDPYLHGTEIAPAALRVMPAGPIPPNPRGVLKSPAVKRIFQGFGATGADVVVVASLPVTSSADSRALAAQVDGVIVVIGRSHARKERLVRMKRRLDEAGARVLGYVIVSEPLNRPEPAQQQGILESAPH